MFNMILLGNQKKKNVFDVTARAMIWFTISNIILKGISFVSAPIFAHTMSPNEYGTYSIYISYLSLILTISTWEVPLSAYLRGLYRYGINKSELDLFTKVSQLFSNTITVVVFIIIAIFYPLFYKFTGISGNISVLIFIYMISQPGYSLWISQNRVNNSYKAVSIVTLLYGFLSIIIPLLAVFAFNNTAEVRFIAFLIVSIIIYAGFSIKNFNYIFLLRFKEKIAEQFKFIFNYQFPLLFHALSCIVLAQADRVMIGKMTGEAEAAFYSIAYSMGSVLGVLQSSIEQAIVPWRLQKLNEKKYADIKKFTNITSLIIASLIFLFILVAPEALLILFPKSYSDAIWCIPPIAVSLYFTFVTSPLIWIENYYDKTSFVAVVAICMSIINVTLNYIGIQLFGYMACAYTTLITYIIEMIGHYAFAKLICKKNNIKEPVYDNKFISITGILLCILSIVVTLIYEYWILRYSLLIFCIFIGLINQKKLNNIVKIFIKKR